MQQAQWSVVLVCIVTALLGGCGGGEGTNPLVGGGGGGSGLISDAQRTAALAAVEAQFKALGELDGGAKSAQMLAFLRSRPEFEASDTNESGAWARFKDGRVLMIVDNRDFTSNAANPLNRGLRREATTAKPRATVETGEFGNPRSKSCLIFQSGGKLFKDSTFEIKSWLDNAGYSAVRSGARGVSNGSVDELKNVKDVGLFYLGGHGGLGEVRNDPQKEKFAVWTSTPRTPHDDQKYSGDLDGSQVTPALVYMLADNDKKDAPVWHYAFTNAFVAKYRWSFAPNSLFYLDTCMGQHKAAAVFRDFIKQAGASVYIGWSNNVTDSESNESANYFFDILTGANSLKDTSSASPKPLFDPPSRPFDYGKVLEFMRQRGRISSTYINKKTGAAVRAELMATPFNLGFGGLRPTIEKLSVDEKEKLLEIDGRFDTIGNAANRPKVYVLNTPPAANAPLSGTTLQIKDDLPYLLRCKLPDMGNGAQPAPGSAGYIVVEIDGRRSNVVPLTAWKGKFTYTILGYGSHKEEITFDLNLRLDVHRFRQTPGASPQAAPSGLDGEAARDSKVVFRASGSNSFSAGSFNGVDLAGKTITWSVNGSPTIPHISDYPGNPTNNDRWWSVFADYQESSKKLELDFRAILPKITHWSTVNHDADLSIGFFPKLEPLIAVNQTNFGLQSGSNSSTFSHDILGNGLTNNATLRWDTIPAFYPPTSTTPALTR